MDESIFLVVLAGLSAGMYGSLVGGGSLLTIPVLMLAGLPPYVAVATNRLGIAGIMVGGWMEFHRQKILDYKVGWKIAVPTFFGSIFGAQLILEVPEQYIKYLVASVTLLFLVLGAFKRDFGENVGGEVNVCGASFAFFIIGVYGGFYGAGAGTLLSIALISFYKQDFITSAATRKIAAAALLVPAIFIFGLEKKIDYEVATILFTSAFIGAIIASKHAVKIGNKNVKKIFYAVSVLASIKLLI